MVCNDIMQNVIMVLKFMKYFAIPGKFQLKMLIQWWNEIFLSYNKMQKKLVSIKKSCETLLTTTSAIWISIKLQKTNPRAAIVFLKLVVGGGDLRLFEVG